MRLQKRGSTVAGLCGLLFCLAAGLASPPAEARQWRDGFAFLFRQAGSRHVLAARQAHRPHAIASLTKLMAALVILDRHLDLQGVTKLEAVDLRTAMGGARTRLRLGARYRNWDLLYAAMLASDNAAVSALGRAVGLGPEALTRAMNRRARLMGLPHTHFQDPVGISHENVSTAWEVSYLLEAAIGNRVLRRVMQTPEHYVRAVWPRRHHINYLSTNLLLFRRGWRVVGGKTGFNSAAGYCFAAAVHVTGFARPVIGVVLGSRSKLWRFKDFTSQLALIRSRRSLLASRSLRRRGRR